VKVELDLDRLVERWRGPLVGILSARGLGWTEAEELAQDVFAEAWLVRERFAAAPEDERRLGAWLAGIARNLHRAHARRFRPAPTLDETDDPPLEADPGERLEADERDARVRRAIADLPEREREVVRAFYLEETSLARVAALLEITERAAEGLLHRARRRLERTLAREEARLAP